jgi:hypothetical protein
VLECVDHLVYASPDLDAAVDALEGLLGIRACAGGRHPDEGTRNALIALGPDTYLEVFAPDPKMPAPSKARWFGIDGLAAPRVVAWAAKSQDLEAFVLSAHRSGIGLGPVRQGSRVRPDGVALSWSFTDPHTVLEDGLVPFFIDWGNSPHPAGTAARGGRLSDFRAEHPEPDRVRRALRALGIPLRVDRGPVPALVVVLETPRGIVELR